MTADSDVQQIKKAYRRLLSRHHPDKMAGSGAAPEKVREATEATRELHNAYALIRQRRGSCSGLLTFQREPRCREKSRQARRRTQGMAFPASSNDAWRDFSRNPWGRSSF